MAKAWKCYACQHVGLTETFVKSKNGPKCPKCGEDSCTFPQRMYKCTACGKTEDQNFWFGEGGEPAELDLDPLEERMEANPCKGCVEKFENEHFGEDLDEEGLELYYLELHEIEKLPAKLVEVPVKLSAA